MLTTIIAVLIVLSVLVFVHELGHFLVAKRMGVWVEEFGLGFPPRIFAKKIKDTIYSINLFPIGGFVKLHGETRDGKLEKPEQAFLYKPPLTKTLIVLAGIIMNLILAVLCFSIFYSISGFPRETENVRVVSVAPASPSQQVGILVDDLIRKVDKEVINSTDKFIDTIESKKGKRIEIEIERKTEGTLETKKFVLLARESPPEGEGPLGIVITSTEVYFPPLWQRPYLSVYFGFKEALLWVKVVFVGLGAVAGEISQGKVPQGFVGPLGIFAIIAYIWKQGFLPLINFIGVFSVNLAVFNILPFPPLDGGRVVLIWAEKIWGRKILPKVESTIHTIGMIILIFLLLAVTAREIPKLIQSGSLSGFVESILR